MSNNEVISSVFSLYGDSETSKISLTGIVDNGDWSEKRYNP